ncbi:MAG: flavin reductase family protein [Candidatus Cloacimonadota bacterium]|nr:flavin reductase family protein [Candidatus Cloacimonadota bacterium]
MKRTEFSIASHKVTKPQKIVIAIMKCEKKINLITLEWFMRTSIKPPMFAISIGHSRFSHDCLQKFRYFNLCFPSSNQKSAAILAGTKSGKNFDKLIESNLDWFKGRFRQLPIVKGAVANFECEIISQVKSGDHTIFTGEVKYSWIDNKETNILTRKVFEEK